MPKGGGNHSGAAWDTLEGGWTENCLEHLHGHLLLYLGCLSKGPTHVPAVALRKADHQSCNSPRAD